MHDEILVKVKFFSKENGGRHSLPEDLLSSGKYRPHFVVGDPGQKEAIIDENNNLLENYLGIAFTSQEEPLVVEKDINAKVITIYPNTDYSLLKKGITFTVREGGNIIGNGEVI